MSNLFIPDQLDQMSKKELLEFAQTAHEENVKLSKRVKELESHNVKLESYNVKLANESHEYQQRVRELECGNRYVAVAIREIVARGDIKPLMAERNAIDEIANKFALEQKIGGVSEFVEKFNVEYGGGVGEALEEYSAIYCEQLRKEQE